LLLDGRKKAFGIDRETLTAMDDFAGDLADLNNFSGAEKICDVTVKEKEHL